MVGKITNSFSKNFIHEIQRALTRSQGHNETTRKCKLF